ncbi:hypothetical protein GIW45_15695 [Pseudomonas congelans]|uniref:hypothetical protein n=1 Tax=Pseudomonas congelans TaxID=200452 RepID=UPI001F180713|nr:hypothetical protein [Pseudomonas congelans]MCF5165475.1 hypothetical protein [Pseudomonas congelans]
MVVLDEGRDYFAAAWLLQLAREERVFQNPRDVKGSLRDIFANLLPMIEQQEMAQTPDWPETWIHLYGAEDFQFEVYVSPLQVWLDISENRPGQGGSAVYAGIATYAFNTERTFVGDPAGLSQLALRRRTDAMLCSALKHGTTRHLRPHPFQKDGDVTNGVPPLDWIAGNTLDNIQSMIETGIESLAHHVPEIRDVYFCFDSTAFKDAEGGQLLDSTLAEWGNQLAGSGEARAGLSSFKRCILLQSLVRQESGARPALLEQVLRQPSHFLVGGHLDGIFY